MAGKRHHTIPQFLLRGFASSQRGDETKVWMYRKDKPGVELNIVNVAVEQYFYGKPDETDLDGRITDLEDDLASLVESLRDGSGTVGPISSDRISFLVAHLTFRTRHLRESAISVMDSFMGKMEHILTQKDILISLMAKELATEGSTLRELIKLSLLHTKGVPREKLDDAMRLLEPEWKTVAANILAMRGDEYRRAIAQEFAARQQVLPEGVRSGFIDALSKNLSMEGRVALYAQYRWFRCTAPIPLILGDCVCIFETDGARRFRSIDAGDNDETQRLYVPLSANTLLVGTRSSALPVIDWHLLNKASARCSHEFFISSRHLPAHSHLIKGLGLWAGILNDRELQKIVADVMEARGRPA